MSAIVYSDRNCHDQSRAGDEEKIFNLMAIADANLEGKTRIHDIGLTLAKKYIELTHGRIWVDMNYLTGAKVCFSIATDKL